MLDINTKLRTHKQDLGQYFTPDYVAEYMAKWVVENDPTSVLDPAVGDGIFLSKVRGLNHNTKLVAYDIDSSMLDKVSLSFNDAELHHEDYLLSNWDNKYDAIICNPPYNRFQNFNNKDEVIDLFYRKLNLKMSGFSNIYVFFLMKAIHQLNEGGRAAFIIPYEFLSTSYGEIVKEEMLKSRAISKIILFKNVSIFSDVITTSCIILMDKSNQNVIEFISIDSSDGLSNLIADNQVQSIKYEYKDLVPTEKWNTYCNDNTLNIDNAVKLSHYGKVSRGIATGCNPYFVFNKKKAEEFNLNSSSLMPCITHSKNIKTIIFKKEDYEKLLDENSNVLLFNGELSSDENTLNYIRIGEANGVHKKYLTSHRTPWYMVEKRQIADIWIGVFNRNTVKFIMNDARIFSLTSFHGFNLNKEWIDKKELVFCYLISDVAKEYLSLSQREYGGGLIKFEPNDLNKAYSLDLRRITELDEEVIISLYLELDKYRYDDIKSCEIITQLNTIFRKYV